MLNNEVDRKLGKLWTENIGYVTGAITIVWGICIVGAFLYVIFYYWYIALLIGIIAFILRLINKKS